LVDNAGIYNEILNQNVSYYIMICFSLAGMSRSVTIAAAYIMSATTIKLKHVLRLLKACRSISSPNEGFNKQLQYYECNYLLEVGVHHRKYFLWQLKCNYSF